jgi:hypothetical protein
MSKMAVKPLELQSPRPQNPLAPCGRDKSEGNNPFALSLSKGLPNVIPAKLVPDSIREQESRRATIQPPFDKGGKGDLAPRVVGAFNERPDG